MYLEEETSVSFLIEHDKKATFRKPELRPSCFDLDLSRTPFCEKISTCCLSWLIHGVLLSWPKKINEQVKFIIGACRSVSCTIQWN